MNAGPEILLWVDLETTDLDHTRGRILEIGAVLTTLDLLEIHRHRFLVDPRRPIERIRREVDPAVAAMHDQSGLWVDLIDARRYGDAALHRLGDADRTIADDLDRRTPGLPVLLAGSGVSHFDRRWIDAHLPLTAAHLVHYPLDVGVVRRFLRDIATVDVPDLDGYGGTPHRALDDALRAVAEARHYRHVIRTAVEELPHGR